MGECECVLSEYACVGMTLREVFFFGCCEGGFFAFTEAWMGVLVYFSGSLDVVAVVVFAFSDGLGIDAAAGTGICAEEGRGPAGHGRGGRSGPDNGSRTPSLY